LFSFCFWAEARKSFCSLFAFGLKPENLFVLFLLLGFSPKEKKGKREKGKKRKREY
jgi:hypothetical protein